VLGFPLDWRERPEKKATRIITSLGDASIEDENRWGEYQGGFIQNLVTMERVLRPW
jgi:hypothetical protein